MKKTIACLSILTVLPIASTAANVTWQTPQNISGASDVSTTGTYFGSWAPHGSTLTVNGVTFQPNDLPGFATDLTVTYGGYGSPGTPDADYNTLLSTATYQDGSESRYFSWSGMTPGVTYDLQVWAADPRNIGSRRWENFYGDEGSGGQSNPVDFPADGTGVGMWVIGSFVADATGSQAINIQPWSTGGPSAQVNLLQIRAIPEPSSFALLGCGALTLLRLRRRG